MQRIFVSLSSSNSFHKETLACHRKDCQAIAKVIQTDNELIAYNLFFISLKATNLPDQLSKHSSHWMLQKGDRLLITLPCYFLFAYRTNNH